jgi:hypothetical protein
MTRACSPSHDHHAIEHSRYVQPVVRNHLHDHFLGGVGDGAGTTPANADSRDLRDFGKRPAFIPILPSLSRSCNSTATALASFVGGPHREELTMTPDDKCMCNAREYAGPIQPRREKLFQRVWPRMMIGAVFMLEVVWIVFLVYLSIAFLGAVA